MIHDGLVVREEAVEAVVENASCKERVDVANGEQTLATHRHARGITTSNDDVVDEAWKWRNAANEEGCDCTPITAELWMIPVNTVEVVHVWDGNVAAANDEVAVAC